MALAFTHLNSNGSDTDGTSYSTGSTSGTAGRLRLIWVYNRQSNGTVATPTLSGSTCVQVATQTIGRIRVTLFAGTGWAPSSINFSSTQDKCAWIITEWSGVSTPNLRQFKVGSGGPTGTAASITLDKAVGLTASYATVGGFGLDYSNTLTVGGGFTQVSQGEVTGGLGSVIRYFAEYDITPTDGTVDTTWNTNSDWVGIAVEVTENVSADLSGTGSLSATGVRKTFGAADLIGVGTMSIVGSLLAYSAPDAKVYLETAPDTWVELTEDLIQGSTDRGRNNELDKYKTGTAALILRNNERKYDPVNAASPYYGFLDVRHRMKIEAVQAGVTYPIFLGYIDEIQEGRALSNTRATVIIKLSDYFKVLNKAVVNGTDFASQLPGERMDTVLDLVALDASLREIDTGGTVLQPMTDVSSTLLSHLQTVAQTEFGDFFVMANGVVRFRSRNAALDEPVQATFGDGPTELHYNSLTPQYNDSLIRNPVSVDRVGGIRQTVEDTELSANPPTGYGKNHYSLSGTYHNSDADALSAANYILARYKTPSRRVVGLGFGPVPYIEGPLIYPQILGRELTEKIVVIERPLGIGTQIVQASVIEGIRHDFSPGKWRTNWNVSPGFAIGDFWQLNVSELGTETVLYPWDISNQSTQYIQLDNPAVTIEGASPGRLI